MNTKIYKQRDFTKWAKKEKIPDYKLIAAIDEIERGVADVRLGAGLYKKRIATANRGKSGGARTLIAYKEGDRAFFVHGFCKNEVDNITSYELKQLKMYAKLLLSLSPEGIIRLCNIGQLKEIKYG